MKRFIRDFLYATFALYTASIIAEGIVFQEGIITMLLAGLGLMLSLILAKPVINILLLPLNLITFGLFRWISSAIILYLVTMIVPGFVIEKFYFSGLTTEWFDIPAINLEGIFSFVGFALIISILTSFLNWLKK